MIAPKCPVHLISLTGRFGSMDQRLHALRLELVARTGVATPPLLMFPNELAQLKGGLRQFLDACLADHPYLERPFLRGLFLSSGHQEGGAVSAVLGERLPPVPPHPARTAGVFLHDFFDRVLPRDEHVARPAALLNPWRRVTRNVGLAAWLLALVALTIVLCISFVGNLRTIELVRETPSFDAALDPSYTGHIERDLPLLRREADALARVESNNRQWLAKWTAAGSGVDELEERLRERFVTGYRVRIVPYLDENRRAELALAGVGGGNAGAVAGGINDGAGSAAVAPVARDLTREIGLLQARQRGAMLPALAAMPQPVSLVPYSAPLNSQLTTLQLAYLASVTPADPVLARRLHENQTALDSLAYTDPQMRWVASLPLGEQLMPVRSSDFWHNLAPSVSAAYDASPIMTPSATSSSASSVGGTLNAALNPAFNPAEIPAALTAAGHARIERFLDTLRASTGDVARFDVRRAAFDAWYQDQRVQAWRAFVENFAAMPPPISEEAQWRLALGSVAGMQSPYYLLIARLADEFKKDSEASLPAWLRLARQIQQVHEEGAGVEPASGARKMVGALNAVGGKAVHQLLEGAPQQGSNLIRDNLSVVDTLTGYMGEVAKLAAESAKGGGQDYQIAANFHQTSGSTAPTPSVARNAEHALAQVKTLLGQEGAADPAQMAIWRLIQGPLDFVMHYVEQQTACQLQQAWEANVLWPLQTATSKAAMKEQLFGAKGSVWAFADGPAKPFLIRDAKRYDVVRTLGHSVPFAPAFLPMLNTAVDQRVSLLVGQQQMTTEKQRQQVQAQQAQLKDQQLLDQLDQALAAAKQKSDAAKAQAIALTINAEPTGVNAGAKAQPFVTNLTIQCGSGAQVLNNYNFPVSNSFTWKFGQCLDTRLQIRVGDLVLTRDYPGAMGVAHFLADFRGGLHQFSPDDFPAQKSALSALGITQITVRYSITGLDAVLDASGAIDAYTALEQSTAQQKKVIQDQQASRQQQSLDQQLDASQPPPLPPGLMMPLPGVPSLPTSPMGSPAGAMPPDAGDLVPQKIALCWASAKPVSDTPDVSATINALAHAESQTGASGSGVSGKGAGNGATGGAQVKR